MTDGKPARAVLDAELDGLRSQRFAQLQATLAQKQPAVLYHYSRAATLEKILESRCVWATEGRYLNDSTELRHASDVALEFLRENWRGEPSWLLPPLMRAIERDAETRSRLMFVVSFSRARDSLSQWRAYADDGAGLAIGFDLSELKDTGDAPGAQLAGPSVDRCIYNPRRQREAVQQCLPEQIAAGIQHVANGGDEATARIEVTRSVLVTVGLLGCILKQPGFREEREWRVLVMAKAGPQPRALKFRDSKYGPAPYVEVPLGGSVPITNIVLGPRTDRAVERTVRLMLEAHSCSAVVERSRVTYR